MYGASKEVLPAGDHFVYINKGLTMGFFSAIKQSYGNHQDKKAKERAEEEARQNAIVSGEIEPIDTDLNLDVDEKAYIAFSAQRMGMIAHTVSNTQKTGVLGRAVVGGLLLGPLGALGGAATAGDKTREKTVEKIGKLDNGVMTFTNKRFIFIGHDLMVSIPYEKAAEVKFARNMFGLALTIKYTEMAKGEFYNLSGQDSKISELWLKGIKKKAVSK